jgi:hypothetical protein
MAPVCQSDSTSENDNDRAAIEQLAIVTLKHLLLQILRFGQDFLENGSLNL